MGLAIAITNAKSGRIMDNLGTTAYREKAQK